MPAAIFDHTLSKGKGKVLKYIAGGGVILYKEQFVFPKIVVNFPVPKRSYPVKENHIGSVVSKILWYTQTDILLLYYEESILNLYILYIMWLIQFKDNFIC